MSDDANDIIIAAESEQTAAESARSVVGAAADHSIRTIKVTLSVAALLPKRGGTVAAAAEEKESVNSRT